ncbi:MAG: hypothetical protein M3418_10450 [Gemmatimonadota bacterium]|jgi:hypothetical protein|nr:hypothetical protein [Gemmatimonadota bacterium]
MTDADLWTVWGLWMAVAAVIILIAAALLVTIWLTARSILAHAVRALHAAEAIRQNTLPIWELQTSNEVAGGLLETVQSIEAKGAALVEALESHAGAGGR